MYTLYKIVNGADTILAHCDDPIQCAQAIMVDAEASDEIAEYRWEMEADKA